MNQKKDTIHLGQFSDADEHEMVEVVQTAGKSARSIYKEWKKAARGLTHIISVRRFHSHPTHVDVSSLHSETPGK